MLMGGKNFGIRERVGSETRGEPLRSRFEFHTNTDEASPHGHRTQAELCDVPF